MSDIACDIDQFGVSVSIKGRFKAIPVQTFQPPTSRPGRGHTACNRDLILDSALLWMYVQCMRGMSLLGQLGIEVSSEVPQISDVRRGLLDAFHMRTRGRLFDGFRYNKSIEICGRGKKKMVSLE